MDPSHRVSDADREQSILELRDHLLEGRLTLDEFTQRVEIALQATTRMDLVSLGSDLPVPQVVSTTSSRKPVRISASLFGHVVKRGRMRLRRRTLAISAFSDIDLDLREAEIEFLRTTVTAFIGFGNIDVYVPEGVIVDVGGLTVFGHLRDWGRDIARADAPYVHVRAFSLFGTVDVWRVPHDARGDYGELMRQVQQPPNELPQ